MDRIQLKTDAKDAMRTANPHPVLVALIYTVIVAAVQMIISTFSGFSSMLTSIFGGDSASIFILGMLLPTLLTSIVASFVVAFLELGFVGYTLRVINRQPAGISDLFAYARLFLKAWGLSFMIGLFVDCGPCFSGFPASSPPTAILRHITFSPRTRKKASWTASGRANP